MLIYFSELHGVYIYLHINLGKTEVENDVFKDFWFIMHNNVYYCIVYYKINEFANHCLSV